MLYRFLSYLPDLFLIIVLMLTVGVFIRYRISGISFNTTFRVYKEMIKLFYLPFVINKYKDPLMKYIKKAESNFSTEEQDFILELINSRMKFFFFLLRNYKVALDFYELKALKIEMQKNRKTKYKKFDFEAIANFFHNAHTFS